MGNTTHKNDTTLHYGLERRTKARYSSGEFKALALDFKVKALLSDGQWYSVDKLSVLTGESNEDIAEFLSHELISHSVIARAIQPVGMANNESNHGETSQIDVAQVSYRMDYDQLKLWRDTNSIELDEQIVEGVLYPRIYTLTSGESVTEVDLFLSVPRRECASVLFRLTNPQYFNILQKELFYMGTFVYDSAKSEAYRLLCSSTSIAVGRLREFELRHGGKGKVFTSLAPYNSIMRREVEACDEHALAQLVRFYTGFVRVLMPSLDKVFATYLSHNVASGSHSNNETNYEADSIIAQWILADFIRYDEQSNFPFSAFLNNNLPHQVAGFTDEILGVDLSIFQREKNYAIKTLQSQDKATARKNKAHRSIDDSLVVYSDEKILETIHARGKRNYTMGEYKDLDSQLSVWQHSRTHMTLNWSQTGEQRALDTSAEQEQSTPEPTYMVNEDIFDSNHESFIPLVSQALCIAGKSTQDWQSMYNGLYILPSDEVEVYEFIEKSLALVVSREFMDSFMYALRALIG